MSRVIAAFLLFAIVFALRPANARAKETGSSADEDVENIDVSRRGSLVVGGKTLRYTANACHLELRDGTGPVRARMFLTSYVLDGSEGVKNPLGLAAHHLLALAMQNLKDISGVYVMGKAATMYGRLGDVMIPNLVFDMHSRRLFTFENCFNITIW